MRTLDYINTEPQDVVMDDATAFVLYCDTFPAMTPGESLIRMFHLAIYREASTRPVCPDCGAGHRVPDMFLEFDDEERGH